MSAGEGLFAPRQVRRRLRDLSEEPQVGFAQFPDISREDFREAAVLIPLTEIDGRMCAVFTKRKDSMPEHPGEVSFPGGGQEEEDRDLRQTALRETEEEIELAADDVQLYGNLVCMPTVTGYVVTTYVGEFVQPYDLEPSPREIETLFMAPLDVLADPARHQVQQRDWHGHTFDLHFFEYQNFVIWGATGYMLYLLLEFLRSAKDK